MHDGLETMCHIEMPSEAREDLQWFRKYEQALICEELEKQLRYQPAVETRHRKRLQPDHLSEWELRIGDIRIFYDVDLQAALVRIVRIGYKKRAKLFLRGQEYTP